MPLKLSIAIRPKDMSNLRLKNEILRPVSGAEIRKNNDGHKSPLLEAQKLEESCQFFCFRKNAILCSKIIIKVKVQK